MRILLLTHYWAPETGAPQMRWGWLARGLVRRGHELAVLAPPPHYPTGRLLDADPRHAPGAVHRDPSGAMIHRTAFRPYDVGLGAGARTRRWLRRMPSGWGCGALPDRSGPTSSSARCRGCRPCQPP
ncbi:hypothetical protein [Actinomyces sp. 432]|uniref:hypothetical protein n=1 Tax=Actinomyces sp. 432 TaxID=2057798 RepID=UPI001F18670C|nr:hypothetical protein [Actinomyces sp. 432]